MEKGTILNRIVVEVNEFDELKVQEHLLKVVHEDVEINVQDKSDNTCLLNAVENNKEAVVDALLSTNNVDIEIKNEGGESPLMVAVNCGNAVLVEKLIKKGAVVDTEDYYQNTPLMLAVELNLELIVEMLLKSGASCSVENKRMQTPLLLSIVLNYESIFDKLIEAGADVNMANGIHGTPMEAALTVVNLSIARKLLTRGAFLDISCVFSSLLNCYSKHFAMLIDFILEKEFDVNVRGCENLSFLHVAVIRSNVTVVENLLNKGANVNSKDNSGETPLHVAARLANCSIVALLLKHNSDVNAKDNRGQTALHLALMSLCEEMVRLLLNAGADINILDSSGISPLALSLKLPGKIVWYMLCARKMELAKLCINLLQNDGVHTKKISTLWAFESMCIKELDQMKAVQFGDISLYNIFSDCNNPVFASNSDMKVYVKSNTLNNNFPLYGGLLRKTFKDGTKRNILLDEISLSVRVVKGSNVTYIVLPNEMSREILVFLGYSDLLNVKRAFNINKYK